MAQDEIKTVRETRREEILEAALREFVARGFSGASMEAIARRAKASKETLYAWFGNKEKLFNTLFAERIEQIVRTTTGRPPADPDPRVVLPVIAAGTLRFTMAIAPLMGVAVAEGNKAQSLRRGMKETLVRDRTGFHRYLEWCRDQGRIAFDAPVDEIGSIFIGMAMGEWQMRVGYGLVDALTEEMIEAHAQLVTQLFLSALAPKP